MIEIFDLRRKKEIKSIPAHLKLVSDLTYSENGALLFSAGHDNVIKIWHGRNYSSVGAELEHAAKISSISYSSGKLGATMLDRKWTIWSNKKYS
jgi:WD40 repeat protein